MSQIHKFHWKPHAHMIITSKAKRSTNSELEKEIGSIGSLFMFLLLLAIALVENQKKSNRIEKKIKQQEMSGLSL